MATKKTYIVTFCDSACDCWVDVSRVIGTVYQVKKYLVSLVKECKKDKENWSGYDGGSETVKEVFEHQDGRLFAYVCGGDHHADINAYPEDSLIAEEL